MKIRRIFAGTREKDLEFRGDRRKLRRLLGRDFSVSSENCIKSREAQLVYSRKELYLFKNGAQSRRFDGH